MEGGLEGGDGEGGVWWVPRLEAMGWGGARRVGARLGREGVLLKTCRGGEDEVWKGGPGMGFRGTYRGGEGGGGRRGRECG